MTNITAGGIKELRERTGAGMMDCKKALVETAGDLEAAIDVLRKKGLSALAKKSGRVAAEGVVAAAVIDGIGVILEVNTETDFVAKNEEFRSFVDRLIALISSARPASTTELMALPFIEEQTVAAALSGLVSKIGENISIRRFESVSGDNGVIGTYVHAGGKIAALVGVSAGEEAQARDIAMHVAAANPQFIRRDEVPTPVVDHEKDVLRDRAAASGKPEAVIERIITGQLNKFFSESCLLEQHFVKDPDQLISGLLKAADPDATVVAMHRYQLGEGIEKKSSDFAAEVAAQIHG